MTMHICPCGDRLWTRDELLAEHDEMATHIAEAYLSGDVPLGFCADEDDVVPLGYAAETIRRRGLSEQPCPAGCDPAFGCDACCVPLDFPLEPFSDGGPEGGDRAD